MAPHHIISSLPLLRMRRSLALAALAVTSLPTLSVARSHLSSVRRQGPLVSDAWVGETDTKKLRGFLRRISKQLETARGEVALLKEAKSDSDADYWLRMFQSERNRADEAEQRRAAAVAGQATMQTRVSQLEEKATEADERIDWLQEELRNELDSVLEKGDQLAVIADLQENLADVAKRADAAQRKHKKRGNELEAAKAKLIALEACFQ